MGKVYRAGRLSEEIKKIISSMLLKELKDPRLNQGMVSVTAVEVTADGSYATVYLSVFPFGEGNDLDQMKEDVLEGMRNSAGTIKREIGRQVKLRHIPSLIFKLDTSLDYGMHIDGLLNKMGNNDDNE